MNYPCVSKKLDGVMYGPEFGSRRGGGCTSPKNSVIAFFELSHFLAIVIYYDFIIILYFLGLVKSDIDLRYRSDISQK